MILSSEDYLPVATTRPETLLGDTAVAVNPEVILICFTTVILLRLYLHFILLTQHPDVSGRALQEVHWENGDCAIEWRS